jgi:hypothetical protein
MMKEIMVRQILIMTIIVIAALKNINAEEAPDRNLVTVSGYVSDASTGEMLIGASVAIRSSGRGTLTNSYGYFSLRLNKGTHILSFSYLGYKISDFEIALHKDTIMNVSLNPLDLMIGEVVVRGGNFSDNLLKPQMSVTRLDIRNIRQIPAFLGEVDVIKALQLLPGVQATSEGGSGFSVRGGSPDQNLILLDEATVYNPSHLMGFFSVFNNDAVKSVELSKGDIPAEYGGRLSSVVDVRMNDGNMQHFRGQGGIGTISSRLMLEGPIQKDRSSFMLAGRRTYADLFLVFSKNEELRNNSLYFYDFNGKANYVINDRNRIFLSGYLGNDIFKNDNFGVGWGNQTATLRWNHLFSSTLFSNFSLIYTRFNYSLGIPRKQPNSFDWSAEMQDYAFKGDFTWYAHTNSTLRYGFSATMHSFRPGKVQGTGTNSPWVTIEVPRNSALENGVYASHEYKIGDRIVIKYGFRFSSFSNIGEAVVYDFDENFEKTDSVNYGKGEFYNNFISFEPRFSLAYQFTGNTSFKAAYNRNVQYVHLARNSTAGTPLDIWFPSSPNVKPQLGDQFSAGLFRNFPVYRLETSLEGFYKLNHNAIDFKDHAELLLNDNLEGELRFGKAWSYGVEALVRLTEGRINGWVSYTWSRTFREIAQINNGKKYPATYDRPHDISIVINYDVSRRFSAGLNWVYATGSPVTFPTGRFMIGSTIAPVYSDRNAYRLPDYHRLDLSATLRGKLKPGRKWIGEWNLSVYNAYYRKNPWVINFVTDTDSPNVTHAEMTYLFGIIPAISYNFKF